MKHLFDRNQRVNYCGVNAHHQNSIAEQNMRTISEMARAILLHASAHWKQGIESSLWPMAVDYAVYLHNHLPNDKGITPMELFTGEAVHRHHLKDLHVWGCPVYVLDPKLQSGKKLPRREPRSRRGVFLGYSPLHSSNVPLVLNLKTGSISPQFHVVFDDSFSSVISISIDEEPPDFWTEIDLLDRIHKVPLDEDDNPTLGEDWLSSTERDTLLHEETRRTQITNAQPTELPSTTSDFPTSSTSLPPATTTTSVTPTAPTSETDSPSSTQSSTTSTTLPIPPEP